MAKDVTEAIKHNSAVDVIRHGLICVNGDGIARELFDDSYRKQSVGEWKFATNHYFSDYGDLKVYATAKCSECKKAYPFNPTVASEFVERPENLSCYEDWDIDIEPIKAEVLKQAKSNKSLYPFCPNCGAKMKGGAE
jgi:hypothetical protein